MIPNKAFTLLELLISLVVLTIIVLGLFNIQTFCDYQVVGAARKAQLQNEASVILEKMAKSLVDATSVPGINATVFTTSGSNKIMRAFRDTDGNGMPDAGSDDWVEFNYNSTKYTLAYCKNATYPGGGCAVPDILTTKMISTMGSPDVTFNNATSYLDVNIMLCWDPSLNGSADLSFRCGSLKNPKVQMRARIPLLSVSCN